MKLNAIEEIWLDFWRVSTNANGGSSNDLEEKLSAEKLFALCQVKQVNEFVKQADFQFYQFCVEILIPDVLSQLPAQLVQSIRALAKNLENWLKNALVKVPEQMRQTKLTVINIFATALRRYTSLNHLINTVRSSSQNPMFLDAMSNDLIKVDLQSIKEQVSFIGECDGEMVNKFESEFKETLKTKSLLSATTNTTTTTTSIVDTWAQWLESSIGNYLSRFDDPLKYNEMAKQFLLKWSFFW